MEAFLQDGLLLTRNKELLRPLSALLTHQYDANGSQRQIRYTPGLFRNPQTPVEGYVSNIQQMSAHLQSASDYALQHLAKVLSSRDERAPAAVAAIAGLRAQSRRVETSAYFQALATLAVQTPRDTAIATDLAAAADNSLQLLYAALRGRYRRACGSINVILSIRQTNRGRDDITAYAVAAAVDMADEEDSD